MPQNETALPVADCRQFLPAAVPNGRRIGRQEIQILIEDLQIIIGAAEKIDDAFPIIAQRRLIVQKQAALEIQLDIGADIVRLCRALDDLLLLELYIGIVCHGDADGEDDQQIDADIGQKYFRTEVHVIPPNDTLPYRPS